jgi:SAM-dependent methyltransferase
MDVDERVRAGHYARKQLDCRDRLISWAHRRRFQVGLRLVQELAGRRVLDYGCGDGTFLGLLAAKPSSAFLGTGAEIDQALVDDCRTRLGDRPALTFVRTEELDATQYLGCYDVIVCMEVLEHVIETEVVLESLERLLSKSGRVVISVPVETGFPLVVKEVVRRVAGWRKLGDYPGNTAYSLREYIVSICAGSRQHIVRPIHKDGTGRSFHDHKGFNWMVLRKVLARRFCVERVVSSPFMWLPPHLASQVWFVVRRASPMTVS